MTAKLTLAAAAAVALGLSASASAQVPSISFSLGVRESGTTAPVGGNGGTANGIEQVGRAGGVDTNVIPLDGIERTFTFTFGTDPVTAFAGTTADGTLDGTRGAIENFFFSNSGAVDFPIQLRIDDIVNTVDGTPILITDFETFADGVEAVFQEPRFSGSTTGSLETTPNASLVTTVDGDKVNQVDFDFRSPAATSQRLRLTTNSVVNLPNPAIDFSAGNSVSVTISGIAVGAVIPEPTSLATVGLAGAGLLARRRRA